MGCNPLNKMPLALGKVTVNNYDGGDGDGKTDIAQE